MQALTWKRIEDPPAGVLKVRSANGTVWERDEPGGHYWSSPGWPGGVHWMQLLSWSDLTDVTDYAPPESA